MQEPPGPKYPLTVLSFDSDGCMQLDDEIKLCQNVEWHDSDDREYSSECVILDAERRRVRLKMRHLEVEHISLYDDRPISVEELLKLIFASRETVERRENGCLKVLAVALLGILALGVGVAVICSICKFVLGMATIVL